LAECRIRRIIFGVNVKNIHGIREQSLIPVCHEYFLSQTVWKLFKFLRNCLNLIVRFIERIL